MHNDDPAGIAQAGVLRDDQEHRDDHAGHPYAQQQLGKLAELSSHSHDTLAFRPQ